MAALSASVTINQPVEKIFAYIVSVENHKAWQAGIGDAKLVPAGPVAVGSTYVYTTEVMGRKIETKMQVSAFEPNHKWAVKTVGVPTSVETVYLFEAAGAATKLTISMDVPAGAYPAAAEGAIKAQMQKSLEEQGARLKKLIGG
jgi:uncharacterized protein YndB with AHSA1/START domain